MKKRLISLLLALGLATCCLTACGDKDNSGDGDAAGTTTIRVGTYNGGLGMEWLRDAAKRFEQKYEGKSFADGETGVVVKVVESQAGDMLASRSLDRDVYLTEAVDYYYLQGQGKLADISDVVTASLSAYGEDTTIEQKLDSALNDFLTAKDGKYYAIPFYEGFHGFIYDADMFEANSWFLDENGNFTAKNKSKGIDGKAGTYDDGLPKTYAQFSKLITEIRKDSVTPFVYSTESMDYFIKALACYWADYEGKEKMQRNWSLEGEINVVSGFDDNDNPIIESKTITSADMREIQKQPGKYYALKFLKEVVMSSGQNYESATDFKAAQLQLIQSCLDGENQEGAVAMIIDGSWFENEADLALTFDLVSALDMREGIEDQEYKKTRRLGFMPVPMLDESEETFASGSKNADGTHRQTLVSANDSFCFINAGTKGGKLEASKEFLKFLHTEAELSKFTERTSITRPYDYTVSKSVRDGMSYFGRTLLEMKESSDIVYPYSSNATYVSNSAQFLLGTWGWRSRVGDSTAINPFSHFRANGTTSARTYFEGLYKAH